jgi:hypothetical protein
MTDKTKNPMPQIPEYREEIWCDKKRDSGNEHGCTDHGWCWECAEERWGYDGAKDEYDKTHPKTEPKPQMIDLTPTPQGYVDACLLVITRSTSGADREWARVELIKAMTIAYATYYPNNPEYKLTNKVMQKLADMTKRMVKS